MLALVLALAQDSFTPTSAYDSIKVQGFPVMVSPHLTGDARRDVLAMLDEKLAEINRILPPEPVKKLKSTKIWLDKESKSCVAAAYHPSAQWLREHGFNPDMEKGVELGNAKNVLDWTKLNQPYMVLHELAHAYHFQFLTYEDKSIIEAYEAAVKSGKYDEVDKKPSGRGKHYGLNNPMEFFAETTESYFGLNDFQPLDRTALKEFDPTAYAMVEKAWGVKPPRPASGQER